MMQRLLRLAPVAVLGAGLGVLAYLVLLTGANPRPRDAPGWELLASLPTARGETAAAVTGERLYVIGGLTGLGSEATAEVSVYDPARDAWEGASDLPAPRHHAAAVGLDGTVYVTGGGRSAADWTPQPTLWALPAGAADWEELAPMPEGRLGHRMLALDGRLYVVGGIGASGSVLVYDTAAGTWSTGAKMPSPRDHLAAVAVDGEIWSIGGRSGGQIHTRVDVYDPAADSWREGPSLPEPTSGAAEGVVDGVIVVSGGENPGAAGGVIDRHWRLDARLGSHAVWEPLAAPPLAVHGAHGAALGGRFLVVGGALRQGAFSRLSWTSATQAYRLP